MKKYKKFNKTLLLSTVLSLTALSLTMAQGGLSIDATTNTLVQDTSTTQATNELTRSRSINNLQYTERYNWMPSIPDNSFAGAATSDSYLSVGTTGNERQIKNVAAGAVDKNSTDAINGSQLAAATALMGNLGTTTASAIGAGTTVLGDGRLSIPSKEGIAHTGKTTISDAIEASRTTIDSEDQSIRIVKREDKGSIHYDLSLATPTATDTSALSNQVKDVSTKTDTLSTQVSTISNQVKDVSTKADAVSTQVNTLSDHVGNLSNHVDNLSNRVSDLSDEVKDVGSLSAALSALKPIQYDPAEPTQIMAGVGTYHGSTAGAIGLAHYTNDSTMIHAGAAYAGRDSKVMANAGITMKFGSGHRQSLASTSNSQEKDGALTNLEERVNALETQNNELVDYNKQLAADNESLKAKLDQILNKL